jgi:hypothetical protein
MISTQVTTELEGLKGRAQAIKTREAYRVFKSIAMRRFVDKVHSPQCQVDLETVTAQFQHNWARGLDEFREATQGQEFHLDA